MTTTRARSALAVVLGLVLLVVTPACAPPPARPAPPATGESRTLPPRSALPSDAACRARVHPATEKRAVNTRFNQTAGRTTPADPDLAFAQRVAGSFTGTTDEIIQWTACKWGIATDLVRAQVALESWWHQDATGDFTANPGICAPGHPIGADGRPGLCPESIGLMQVRTQYFRAYIDTAVASSSYNLDVAYAVWRSCFEGTETWLNTVERGRQYAAGDAWGCMGRWFSGRWYTAAANDYIARVQDYLARRIWTTSDFANG
jgi:hypothetical protein